MRDDATARLLRSWLEWVKLEAEGVDDGLVEGLDRMRGAVMSLAAAALGESQERGAGPWYVPDRA